MGEVLEFTGDTTIPLPPDQVLDGARGKLEWVLVIGWQPDGEAYYASSHCEKAELLLAIEKMRFKLLAGDFDGDG